MDTRTESKIDEMKGRAKEAAGDMTGDGDLQREGRIDQAKADFKDKAGRFADTVSDKIDEYANKLNDRLDREDGRTSAG